ncbi:MAG: MFS transporter [Prolixibacteraceae bacterium]
MQLKRINQHKDNSLFMHWIVLFLLFLGTVICYIDRLTISYLAPVIKEDLGITNLEYAGITTWFLLLYSIFQIFAGRLFDKIGTKKAYAASITVWSIAAMLHATTKGIVGLSFFRGLLGIGESGHWPGVTKGVAEWFPIKSRAFAMGLVNTGASIGSVISPPLIIWLMLSYGWKYTFIVTGSFGFVWVILWLIFYRSPPHQIVTNPIECANLVDNKSQDKGFNTRKLYASRKLWGITIARFFGDPIWWLYLVWLPLYLKNEKGFSMEEIGSLAWIPYLFAAVGGVAGGWFSGFLIRHEVSVNNARKIAIVVGTLFLPVGLLVINAQSNIAMWFFISLTLFGFQFWVNNVQTLPSDIYERKYVGSVAGMGQSGAGFGSMIFVLCTGWVVDHFSYTPILLIAGILGPLATLSLFIIGGKIKRISI